MASRLEKNLAAAIFRLQKNGNDVPPDVRGAARRILQDKNSAADVEMVRRWQGIGKGGAGALRRGYNQARGVVGSAERITDQIGMYQSAVARGGGGIQAVRLAQTITREFEGVLKNKYVKATAEKAAQIISKTSLGRRLGVTGSVSGLRFLRSVGRMARLGGVVGTAVAGAMSAFDQGSQELRGASEERLKRDTLKQQFNGNPVLAREIERSAALRATGGVRTWGEAAGNLAHSLTGGLLGFEGRSASTEKAITQEMQKELKTREAMRKHLSNPEQILQQGARARGMTANLLTERERNEILDSAANERVNPQEFMNDPIVLKRLDAEFDSQTNFFEKRFRETMSYVSTGSLSGERAKRQLQLAQERAGDVVRQKEAREKERAALAEQAEQRLSPEKRLRIRQQTEDSIRGVTAELSRRKAVHFD